MKSPETVIDGAEITKNVAATIKDIQNGGHNDVLENLEEGINAILAMYYQYVNVAVSHEYNGIKTVFSPYKAEKPISEKAILQSIIGLRSVINTIMDLLPDGDE